jgi:glycosyltransferase involved in cell wall biosynthesis
MRNNILLTIGIPTYNRKYELTRLLDNVSKELDVFLLQKVEILISDNCSNYDVKEILNNIKYEKLYISYYKNKKNLGYAKNIDEIIRKYIFH